eukprot:COSAG06_NODE_685_length_13103_cov_126.328668_19_plen_493_part_00
MARAAPQSELLAAHRGTMEVALVGLSDGGSAGPQHGDDRDGDEQALVRLPPAVEEFVRLGLDGPGSPSLAKHRLMLVAYGSYFLAFGVLMFETLRRVDESLTLAGLLQLAACIGWSVVNPGAVHRFRSALHAEPDGFLAGLLRAEVSPECAAKVTALMKRRLGPVAGTAVWWGQSAFIGWLLYTFRGGLSAVDGLALAVGVVTTPVASVSDPVKDFVPALACAVVADRVKQVTRRVKASTPVNADWSGLLSDTVHAEASVSAVSALLSWSVKGQATMCAFWAMACCFIPFSGLGPSDPTAGWNAYGWPYIFLALGGLLILYSVLALQQPATVTTACEELMDAINKMREARSPGDATLQMPYNILEIEARIDYLLSYVKNLNRRRGKRSLPLPLSLTLNSHAVHSTRVCSRRHGLHIDEQAHQLLPGRHPPPQSGDLHPHCLFPHALLHQGRERGADARAGGASDRERGGEPARQHDAHFHVRLPSVLMQSFP